MNILRKKLIPAAVFGFAISGILEQGVIAKEIAYIETFVLAEDRAAALGQLIPGTEDYYYFYCLHHQAAGDLDAVEKMLTPWIKRHGKSTRYQEIRNRQALLVMSENSGAFSQGGCAAGKVGGRRWK